MQARETAIENFRRATVEVVVLQLLYDEDLYCYQIPRLVRKLSDNLYTLEEPTIYIVLPRLAEKGLIQEYSRIVNKRRRVYYRIEESGRVYCEEILQEYAVLLQGVKNIFAQRRRSDTSADDSATLSQP